VYGDVASCPNTQDSCWRSYFRLFAIGQICLQLPGAFLLLLFRKSDYPHLNKTNEETEPFLSDQDYSVKSSTGILQSLKVFTRPFFWVLFWGYFVGISSSMLVLTQAKQMWASYTNDPSLAAWTDRILLIYSFSNAGSNVICGVMTDWLNKKRIISNTTFLAITMLFFASLYAIIGTLFIIPHENNPTSATAILMAVTGAGFGCYLVLFPILVVEAFGPTNFGKFFGFLQISSSIASLAIPQIINVLQKKTGDYSASIFGCTGLLVTSAAAFLLIPKQRTSVPLRDFSSSDYN